jgi:hypothetical protein
LYLAVRKRYKVIALQEVEDALAEEVHDDANMSPVVEAIPEMDAAVAVLLIVRLQRAQDPELNLTGIAVLLDRSDDLDSHAFVASSAVDSLDDLSERALSQKLVHLIYGWSA